MSDSGKHSGISQATDNSKVIQSCSKASSRKSESQSIHGGFQRLESLQKVLIGNAATYDWAERTTTYFILYYNLHERSRKRFRVKAGDTVDRTVVACSFPHDHCGSTVPVLQSGKKPARGYVA